MNNKLIIAAAGAGKTTYLVQHAYLNRNKKILITTYTDNNASEIKQKFIDLYGTIPGNVVILTWVSFLLVHGVRPYQSCYNPLLHDKNIGFVLVSEKSGFRYKTKEGFSVYWGENDFLKYFFSDQMKIYSDKISKFVHETNEYSDNAVINRLRKIFDCVYIDEIQDLVGYDLDIVKSLFKVMDEVLLVGDPRQCTYSTHNTQKYSKYAEGNIKKFISEGLGKRIQCCIDEQTLNVSHRNFKEQCFFASLLYPNLPTPEPCDCSKCRAVLNGTIEGLFLVKSKDIEHYLQQTNAIQLRWDKSCQCSTITPCFNFGESKGMTFEHTLIYLTAPMRKWLKDRTSNLDFFARSKFYVALTRARHSVALVWDEDPSLLSEFMSFDCYR